MSRRYAQVIALAAVALVGGSASAQFGGGGMRPMGPAGGGPTGPEKQEEGPAEAAPETQGQEPALQPLPAWPGQKEKQLQFFQLDGYLRGRTYLFHNFALGVPLLSSGPSPANPIFVPYSEFGSTGSFSAGSPSSVSGGPTSCAGLSKKDCKSQDLTSADMRLRLEPTINVSEQVRVKAQIDVFDNMVLGSTPEGYYINGLTPSRDTPLAVQTRTQVPPTANQNSFENSIRVKRAWAEVRTPIGELRFGRMPSHWGMGILTNSGDCLDCDFGTNADRVMFATKFKDHFFAILGDWVATGPTTRLFTPNQALGQSFNADPADDVSQVGFALGRNDKPEEVKERVERGDLVLNYGGYFIYRWQNWDQTINPGVNQGSTGGATLGTTPAVLQQRLINRGAWAFIPDLWFRLNFRKLSIEAEGVLVGGQIKRLDDQVVTLNHPVNILQWGGVIRADYKLLHDALHIGLEIGSASGDAHEDPNAVVNYRLAQPTYDNNTTWITNFAFDPDYHVDLILFRRILGTVTNATYFKAHAAYDVIDNLSARIDAIYSIANVPVAYPANNVNLGIELDGSIMYHNEEEGFYAGVSYGVLFPLGALSIPGDQVMTCDVRNAVGSCNIYGNTFAHNADAAQTLQVRLIVKF